MLQDKIYYTSIFTWLSIMMLFVIFSLLTGLPPADIFITRFILINTAGAIIFLLTYELIYSLNFDFKDENNFTKKDLTFLFLLIFGPAGLLPVSFIILACLDKPSRNFDTIMTEDIIKETIKTSFNYIDVAAEYQKQMFKEAVIDSIMSENNFKKRNAIDILSKMKNRQAIAALKLMAKDKDHEIRFMAINKLNAIEDEYMHEFDWYKTAIKVCGAVPELVFQYAALILKFCRLEIMYNDLSYLYYKKAAGLFKALIDENHYPDESLYAYAVCLRNTSNASGAAALLEKRLNELSGKAVDELAACYYDIKNNNGLKYLIDKAGKNEIQYGPKLGGIISKNTDEKSENDEYDGSGNENSSQNELYSIYNINEFLQIFKSCQNLNFDQYYARLKTVTNTAMYPAIFNEIYKMPKFSKILYLKLLKGQLETENARNLKYFLYDPDPALVFFAADVLCTTELPLRNEIFTGLILHPLDEVKILSVKFAGLKRMRRTVRLLIKLLKSSKTQPPLKKEIITALIKIGDNYANSAISAGLKNDEDHFKIHALNEIKNFNARLFLDDIIQLIDSSPIAIKIAGLNAAASFGGEQVFKKLTRYLKDDCDDILREAATAEFCRAMRPEAIECAVKYYSRAADNKKIEIYNNYFSYLSKTAIENYIKKLIDSKNYIGNDFLNIIFKFRHELVSSIAENNKKEDNAFYEYCEQFISRPKIKPNKDMPAGAKPGERNG